MSDTQFTPGPWTLETVKTSCGICHKVGPFPWREGRDNHACIYHDYPNGVLGPVEMELRANAALIASAPDLYEELSGVLAWATLERAPLRTQEIERIRAVLACARGGVR